MGKRSSSREQNVKKESPELISGSGTSSGSGRKSINNDCLFKFQDNILIADSLSQHISESNEVTLTLGGDSLSLNIFMAGKYIGNYIGKYLTRLINCIIDGYFYGGRVVRIQRKPGGRLITFEIRGTSERE